MICMYVCKYASMNIHIYIYVCINIYVIVCIGSATQSQMHPIRKEPLRGASNRSHKRLQARLASHPGHGKYLTYRLVGLFLESFGP